MIREMVFLYVLSVSLKLIPQRQQTFLPDGCICPHALHFILLSSSTVLLFTKKHRQTIKNLPVAVCIMASLFHCLDFVIYSFCFVAVMQHEEKPYSKSCEKLDHNCYYAIPQATCSSPTNLKSNNSINYRTYS